MRKKFKVSNILLLGSTGQVGFELYKALKPFVNIIRPNSSELNLLNLNEIKCKLDDIKFDLIINASAYTDVDGAEENFETAFKINSLAPKILAEVAEKLSIPIIHISTDYVFDGENKHPYKEEDTPNPMNVYGESKLMGEENIKLKTENYIIFRSSWIYSNRRKNFFKTIIKLFLSRNELKVVNDQIGTPTCAFDIAESIVFIIKKLGDIKNTDCSFWGLYHLSAFGETSWYNFANQILQTSKINKKISLFPITSDEFFSKAKRPKYSVLNTSKLQKTFDVQIKDWKTQFQLFIERNLN